ncbi:MAG: hypothetical protein WB341_18580, partial [Terracidiphilus sp.]
GQAVISQTSPHQENRQAASSKMIAATQDAVSLCQFLSGNQPSGQILRNTCGRTPPCACFQFVPVPMLHFAVSSG